MESVIKIKPDASFKRHYPGLDILRAIAITMVMLTHFSTPFRLPPDSAVAHVITWCIHGVTLFFVLSGFLIGGQIIEALKEKTFSFKVFYLKRSFRIFPPYYFSLLVVAIVHFSGFGGFFSGMPAEDGVGLAKDFLVHIFYVQNYIEVSFQSLFWSLALEEQFYLTIPFLLVLVSIYARKHLHLFIIALILSCISLRLYLYLSLAGTDYNYWLSFWGPFHTNIDILLYGVLGAYFFLKDRNRKWVMSGVGILILLFISFSFISLSIFLGEPGPSFLNACVLPVITGIGFGTLILLSTNIESIKTSLIAAPFRYVARLSYTMYLYHMLLRKPVLVFLKSYADGSSGGFFVFTAGFVIYFLVVLAISDLFYRLIDRPVMSFGRRYIASILSTGKTQVKRTQEEEKRSSSATLS